MRERGTAVVEGDAIIEGRLAEGRIAKLLKIEEGAPILYYERVGCAANGEHMELVQMLHEATHYKFRIHLTTKI